MRQDIRYLKISGEDLIGLSGPSARLWTCQWFAGHRGSPQACLGPHPHLFRWSCGLEVLLKEEVWLGIPQPQHVSHTVFTSLVSALPEAEDF